MIPTNMLYTAVFVLISLSCSMLFFLCGEFNKQQLCLLPFVLLGIKENKHFNVRALGQDGTHTVVAT